MYFYTLHAIRYSLPAPRCTLPAIRYSLPAPRSTLYFFMQNKPNFKNDKINVTIYMKRGYENCRLFRPCKNKANQTQF